MKKIVVFVVLSMLLCACSKSEDSYQEPISWKTGMFISKVSGQSSLMITFTHKSKLVEEVRFCSEWTIQTRSRTYTTILKDSDFIWANEEKKLEGIFKIPLQLNEYQGAHVKWLSGEAKIGGRWRMINFN